MMAAGELELRVTGTRGCWDVISAGEKVGNTLRRVGYLPKRHVPGRMRLKKSLAFVVLVSRSHYAGWYWYSQSR